MKSIRTLVFVLVIVNMLVLAAPGAMAPPIGDDEGEYHPPGWIPPTEPPPEPPPELPAWGYFTVDSPSGSRFVDYHNVYDPYAVVHRNGPASWAYVSSTNYSSLAQGGFPDSSQAYEWPKQIMPTSNATIMSVYLLVVAKIANYQVLPPYTSMSLQYSIDGQSHYYPALYSANATFDVTNYGSYEEYLFNVTTYQEWTPQIMLSSQTFVRAWFQNPEIQNPALIDYVGLRYNWTFGSGPSEPPKSWPNSTLAHVTMAQMVIGGIGMIGFVGMIITPAAGILLMRQSDEKEFMLLKIISMFIACFGLFLYAISGG